jgi:hypothetical protein
MLADVLCIAQEERKGGKMCKFPVGAKNHLSCRLPSSKKAKLGKSEHPNIK